MGAVRAYRGINGRIAKGIDISLTAMEAQSCRKCLSIEHHRNPRPAYIVAPRGGQHNFRFDFRNPKDLERQVAETGRSMRRVISCCASSTVVDSEPGNIPSSFASVLTHALRTAPWAPVWCSNGKKTEKAVPVFWDSALLFTWMVPPCFLTISELTHNPRPVPVSLLVLTNGSNSVFLISG